MPRLARVVIPGCPHHVTQRGNRREDVFACDADRRRYLALLGHQVGDWKAFLRTEDEEEVRVLRARTRTGRPCGDEQFVTRLECRLGPPPPPRQGRPASKEQRRRGKTWLASPGFPTTQ